MGSIGSNATPEFVLAIFRDPNDPLASQESVLWAVEKLVEACEQHSIQVVEGDRKNDITESGFILIGRPDTKSVASVLQSAGAVFPAEAEAFCIAGREENGIPVVAAAGIDVRGLVYAVLEIADRIRCAVEPLAELSRIDKVVEKPSTPVRSIMRSFVNELEDSPWFYDEGFWDSYLTELATYRFNRFHLALGIGYDYGHDPNVRDNFLNFSYPFFVQVPGYDVKVAELSDIDRQTNLKMELSQKS